MRALRASTFLIWFTVSLAAQVNVTVPSSNQIQLADKFPGADACIKMQNAIAALPTNGGEIDARGFPGFQHCSANPFANIVGHPGESVHLYLAAGSVFTTTAQWDIPTSSIVTGGGRAPIGGGRGTTIKAARSFPPNTAVIYLGDTGRPAGIGQGSKIENLTVDCNHVAGCTGVFSDRVQEQGGLREVSIYNYPAFGVQMLDQALLPPGTGGQPENYILDELELFGDRGSTCINIRIGSGGQRGGGRITCTSANVQEGRLSCSAGVVTATFRANTIPSGVSVGVESGSNLSFGGIFTVTNSTPTQLTWKQLGCSGTSTNALVGAMTRNGLELDGADGNYYQIHCEFTVDCVLIDSNALANGWVTRALSISGVSGQSSVKNIVHLGDTTHPEDIVLTALQRCIGPEPATQGCATNVLQDDIASITLREASLAWYLVGHSSTSGSAPAILTSSPSVNWVMPNPFIIFRNSSLFSQLGDQNNGSFTYCSDCKVLAPSSCSAANTAACVCAGGGTGAFAKRLNGSWLCN